MVNETAKTVILAGHLSPDPVDATEAFDPTWLNAYIDSSRSEVVDLGLLRQGRLSPPAAVDPSEVCMLYLSGRLTATDQPLGGAEKLLRSERLYALAEGAFRYPNLQLVVLDGLSQPELVQQLLLVGVPAVLALPEGEERSAQLEAFFDGLRQGRTLRQVIEGLEREHPAWNLALQELHYDPEKESLYWDESTFSAGPNWNQGLLYRSNQWRSLSWRLRTPQRIPLSERERRTPKGRDLLNSPLLRMSSRRTEENIAEDDPSIRGRSRAVRRGAAKARELREREQRYHEQRRRQRFWRLAVAVALGVAAIAVPLVLLNSSSQPSTDAYGLPPCPFPEESGKYRVVVFPFQIVPGCGPAANRFTDAVRQELKRLREQGLAIDARYQELDNCPTTLQEVQETANLCHTDLFVWGQYLRDSSNNRDYLRVDYYAQNRAREEVFLQRSEVYRRIDGFTLTRADSLITRDLRQLVCWARGVKHIQAGEYELAIEALQRLRVDSDSIRSMVSQELTLAYAKAGRYEQARQHFDNLIRLHPDQPGYYFDRAQMLSLMNEPEEALSDYNRVLELDPGHLEARSQRGLILSRLDRFDEALSDLKLAIQRNPQQAELLAQRARIYAMQEDYQAALADYERALALEPDQAKIYLRRGKMRQSMGEEAAALADVQKALVLNPNLIEASLFEGDVLTQREQWTEAEVAFTRVIEQQNSAEAYARRAYVREQQQQPELALADYQQSASLKPTHTPAWMGQARLYDQLGEPQKALDRLDRVLEQQPGHPEALHQRAGYYLVKQRWSLALQDLDRILEDAPDHPLANYRKAVALLEQGQAEEAAQIAARIEQSEDPLRLFLLKGRIDLAKGAFESALAYFVKAAREDPQLAEAQHYQGVALLRLDRLAQAERRLLAAQRLGYSRPDLPLYLGDVYRKRGDLKEARKAYETGIARVPKQAMGYLRRASLFQQTQRYDSALLDYDRAIELAPESSQEAYRNRGQVKVELERYNQALLDFNQAIREAPGDFMSYCLRGRLYQLMGNFRQAEEDLDVAKELAPNSPVPAYYLGLIYEDRGRDQEALTQLDQALRIDPRFAKGYNLRGEIYARMEAYKPAMQDFQRSLRIDPQYADAYDNQADLTRRAGNYQQAIYHYDQAIAYNPNHADALYHRGFIYYLEGEPEQAIKDIRRSLEIRPGQSIRYATLAQIFASQRKDESFFYYLKLALSNGYPVSELKRDPAFKAYQDHPDFLKLTQRGS